MAKQKYVVKIPNLDQAKAICASGKHPYSHPCSGCGKACSTPTKPFWLKRVKELGSIEKVYSDYKCRACRKQGKPKKSKGVQTHEALPDVDVILLVVMLVALTLPDDTEVALIVPIVAFVDDTFVDDNKLL